MIRAKKAQSVSEYTIGIAVVLLAILAMNVYVKRGLQGRYIDVAEFATGVVTNSAMTQYEPYYRNENFNNQSNTTILERIQPHGIVNKATVDRTIRNGTSIEQINCYDDP